MKTDKMKTIMYYMPVIIFLFALISFIAFVAVHSVRQDNLKRCYFCVRETLTRIWHDQYGYHEKFKRYANFTDLAKFSEDNIVQELARTAKNGFASRSGYNYYIYLLHEDTHSPIHFWGAKEPSYNMLCYAWPKDTSAGDFAFVIDSNGNFFGYYNADGKYTGNNKKEDCMRSTRRFGYRSAVVQKKEADGRTK